MVSLRTALVLGLLPLAGCAKLHIPHHGMASHAAAPVMPTTMILFFHPWSAEVTPVGMDIIHQASAKIKETQPTTVTIAGYAYNDASPDENLKLAKQRVDAVRSALIADGVDPKLFLDIPIGAPEESVGMTGDRRVEIRLQYGK